MNRKFVFFRMSSQLRGPEVKGVFDSLSEIVRQLNNPEQPHLRAFLVRFPNEPRQGMCWVFSIAANEMSFAADLTNDEWRELGGTPGRNDLQ